MAAAETNLTTLLISYLTITSPLPVTPGSNSPTRRPREPCLRQLWAAPYAAGVWGGSVASVTCCCAALTSVLYRAAEASACSKTFCGFVSISPAVDSRWRVDSITRFCLRSALRTSTCEGSTHDTPARTHIMSSVQAHSTVRAAAAAQLRHER